jgi:hypothetical protein
MDGALVGARVTWSSSRQREMRWVPRINPWSSFFGSKKTPFCTKEWLAHIKSTKNNFQVSPKICSLASELAGGTTDGPFFCLAYYKLNSSQEPLHMVYPIVEKRLCFCCCSICLSLSVCTAAAASWLISVVWYWRSVRSPRLTN